MLSANGLPVCVNGCRWIIAMRQVRFEGCCANHATVAFSAIYEMM